MNEPKAVSCSHYAWAHYHQALHAVDPASKQQGLKRARKRWVDSLHWAPKASSYLYLAYVEKALIELDTPHRESAWKTVVAHLSKGLALDPMNLQIRMERAEASLELGEYELALSDAECIMALLENKQHLPEYSGYLERAQKVVDTCEPPNISYGIRW